MQISDFTNDMQQQVICFFKKCFSALGWGYDPEGRHADTAKIEEYYLNGGCFRCLFDNEILVGTVALRIIDEENKVFELKRMFVLPEYQRKGCGSLLLTSAISCAKEHGGTSIRLDTRRELTAARNLYIKNGFKETDKYNQNDHADIFYELTLT